MAKKSKEPEPEPLLTHWSDSLQQTWRVLPIRKHTNRNLLAFLNADNGVTTDEIHRQFQYDQERVQATEEEVPGEAGEEPEDPDDEEGEEETGEAEAVPDLRRFRDMRLLFELSGLLWEDKDGRVWRTDFGHAMREFMGYANEKNVNLIAQHAALALNVCQLRNPTGAGDKYDPSMQVFPNRFIWRAMLELDNRINSEEMRHEICAVSEERMLPAAIDRIRKYRETGDVKQMQPPVLTRSNDRIIPIVCLASFGWTLINQKVRTKSPLKGYFVVKPECVRMLRAALSIPVRHQDYGSVQEYVTRISNAACLPRGEH